MRLAAIVLEEHAGAAVQLRDDDALGAVDDEGAGGGHERDLAHVDLLLLDLLDFLGGGFAVENHQANPGAQRAGEGQSALLALLDIEGRLAEIEMHELQAGIARVRDDRKDRRECRLQALVLPLRCRDSGLQKLRIGLKLCRQQEGHVKHGSALGKALADALFFGVGVGHDRSDLMSDGKGQKTMLAEEGSLLNTLL
ncbi:hypothetical protein GALL_386850 [mine drainage metagenome]|uniref:Uncharacterized protein n=1 Tax=mine drainage metagenome TaxID=410659 RepID=A0A1J5Q7D8_9ZZZZ